MQIPGTVWTALLIALPMLAVWLNEFFPGAIWAAPVAGLLLIGAKVLEVVQAQAKPVLPPDIDAESAPAPERESALSQILWG